MFFTDRAREHFSVCYRYKSGHSLQSASVLIIGNIKGFLVDDGQLTTEWIPVKGRLNGGCVNSTRISLVKDYSIMDDLYNLERMPLGYKSHRNNRNSEVAVVKTSM